MTKQLDISYAIAARDAGIEQAVKHADQIHDRWSDQVYGLFKDFISKRKETFQAEDFRDSIIGLIAEPPSKRAFGAVVVRAMKAGLIKRVGYAPVKNVKAHMAFATVWTSNFKS